MLAKGFERFHVLFVWGQTRHSGIGCLPRLDGAAGDFCRFSSLLILMRQAALCCTCAEAKHNFCSPSSAKPLGKAGGSGPQASETVIR